jgi:hypothetical protein
MFKMFVEKIIQLCKGDGITPEQRYLSEATDLYDLERRMREWDSTYARR